MTRPKPSSHDPWTQLLDAARQATQRSYAPYSNVFVGAAAETTDGRVLVGSNTECASIGLSLCAECALVSELARTGGGAFRRVVAVGNDGEPLAPCGRCRQLLAEFAAPNLEVLLGDGAHSIAELLPWGFGPADVARLAEPDESGRTDDTSP